MRSTFKPATTSPFSRALEADMALMPQTLRDQYLSPADAPYEIVLGGRMTRIWHRPKWLWPALWLLARADVLFPETGEGIPTTLVVRPGRDARGRPIQTWERTFHFGGRRPRRFRSTMTYNEVAGLIVELEGPRNMFEEHTALVFTAPATIDFASVRSFVHIGRWRLSVPRRLWITAHATQHVTDSAAGTSRVTLTLTHGILGPIFGYEGTFRAVRRVRRG